MGMSVGGLVSGIDPKIVEKLMEVERVPIKNMETRKEKITKQMESVEDLRGKLKELHDVINGLATSGQFLHLKMESSHPEIISGSVTSEAVPGTYEMEVRGMAKTEKELAYGFPDKDEFPVGFGWMMVTNDDKDEDIVIRIDPEKNTLQDVATTINEADAGVKAIIVNTGAEEDPYRLLVISEKSGKQAKIEIDPDTTYLEFKEQVTGRNLEVLFEDVPVTSPENTLTELVPGAVFDVHHAEPGTKVTLNITWDLDGTLTGIKDFVEKYNVVNNFIHEQYLYDEKTRRAGLLASDSGLRQIRRTLQYEVVRTFNNSSKKYNTLASIGITTDPKTGALKMDEAKVRKALSEDIHGVANLFVINKESPGLAVRMKEKLKQLSDREYGVLENRKKGLSKVIDNLEEQIAKKEDRVSQSHENLKRKFASLEQMMSSLNQQGQFLSQKFGVKSQPVNPKVRE